MTKVFHSFIILELLPEFMHGCHAVLMIPNWKETAARCSCYYLLTSPVLTTNSKKIYVKRIEGQQSSNAWEKSLGEKVKFWCMASKILSCIPRRSQTEGLIDSYLSFSWTKPFHELLTMTYLRSTIGLGEKCTVWSSFKFHFMRVKITVKDSLDYSHDSNILHYFLQLSFAVFFGNSKTPWFSNFVVWISNKQKQN